MSLVGERIGKIRILEQLGEGGMGQVYLGYDEKLERKVAVKVISGSLRMDPEAKERFDREAKVLSRLEHPNICRIYDFIEGEENDFIVLEFIQGKTLNNAAPSMKWKTKMRVARKIAEVLTEAHKQNIVHRDLKPENITITDDGLVKVLDFGLARAVGDLPTDAEASESLEDGIEVDLGLRWVHVQAPQREESGGFRTEHGVIMGTPMYMSPEQARGETVTAASDMYSFGLLLQWFFTGEQPYPKNLTNMALLVRAMKGETEPVKGMDSSMNSLIHQLKSIAPENRPIARDTLDRLSRISRKPVRRLQVMALTAFVAVLLAGTVVSTMGFVAARRSEREARASEQRAIRGEQAAKETIQLLQEFLASADPREKGKDLKVIDLLEAFRPRLDELEDRSTIKASLYHTYGRTYKGLGLYEESAEFAGKSYELRKQVLGEEHPDTLAALNSLANALDYQGKSAEAEPLFRRCLEIQKRVLGEEHHETVFTLNNLALVLRAQGKLDDAVELERKCLEIRKRTQGEDHPETVASRNNLAIGLYRQGKYAEAEELFRKALESRTRVLGAEHPETLASLNNLGGALCVQGKYDEAEPFFRQCLEIRKRVEGETHPHTLESLNNLAYLFEAQGNYEESERLFRQCLEARKQVLGEEHPATLSALTNLARTLGSEQKYQQAEKLFRQCLETQKRVLGQDHPHTIRSLSNVAWVLVKQNAHLDEAEILARESVKRAIAALGAEHVNTARKMVVLGMALERRGKRDEAASWYRKAARLGDKDAEQALEEMGRGAEVEKEAG